MDQLSAHSKYGASGAHRWTACPGSVAATAMLPETPSSYAQEGTACHAVAALCLTQNQDAIEYVGRTIDGLEIEEEHAIAVQVYLDAIRKSPTVWRDVIAIFDAKFGKGEIIEVKRSNGRPNLQLAFYALGVIYELQRLPLEKRNGIMIEYKFHIKELHPQFFGTADYVYLGSRKLKDIKFVELVIVQPRAWHKDGPVRRVRYPIEEIIAVGEELLTAVRRCEEPNPALIPGSHCKFCRAAGTCPALRNHSLAEAQLSFSDDVEMTLMGATPHPTSLTPQQLSNVLFAAEKLETWLDAVRAYAHASAEKGKIPGWKLVAKQARRKWVDEDAAATDLMYRFELDEDQVYDTRMKSPAQIEKLLKPSERASAAFKNLCPAVSSGLVLVQDTSPRLEVVPSQVAYDDGTSTGEDEPW